MRGKMGLISSGSWMVSEPSDLPLRQVISLLSYWYNGKLYGKLKLYSHLKKMTTSPSLQQVSKKVYTSQGKLEQFLKSTRRETIISFKMSRACISLGSISSALSAGLADGAIWSWTSDLHQSLCVPRKMAYILLWSNKVLASCSEWELSSFSSTNSLI